ncbi:MAG TPA: glycoside hydrolase family 48 protein [Streptosporangiaceae bacterium]|nr:glycoside hydrolase family 48 protein [Streptosporangiaceae bacterium]
MTNRRPRSRMLASALAAATLLSGAVLAASGSASAATASPARVARTSAQASQAASLPPAAAPITSPAAGEVFTPGSSISLQAAPLPVSDSVKDGLASSPVSSITYYASTSLTNNRVVGVAKSAPWTVRWANVPAGDYSVTAVTTDAHGAKSATSTPVAIKVEKPSVVTNQSSLTINKGQSASFGVSLSTAPSSPVTVHLTDSGAGTSLAKGQTLTFTPQNWNQPQQATVAAAKTAGSHSTVTASAAGLGNASVAVTAAPAATGYDQWFLNLYNDITNSANGYFSPQGIPYHSVEQLIVEAPDYGHETTSETYSYWVWLTADFGRVSGDWTAFNNAWSNMQQFMIPNAANQPGCSAYNASSPATYGPESGSPANYPVALNSSVPVGSDPLAAELNSAYGGCTIYAPMWIMDTDNRYGFGQQEDGTSTPSFINTFQRGSEESVWDTVDQPDWDNLSKGESGSGYLALFNNGGGSFASQYKYTDAPDADARLVQAAYWAEQYATAQGNQSQIASTMANAAKLGDFVRYSMYDKYFKQISASCSQNGSTACPAGTSKANEETYLLSWYYAFGGSTAGAWSWRISGTEIHEGYQNPLAAFALSNTSSLIPLSPSAKTDWATSLTTQLNLMQWLQSNEGAIAGGVTNNWGGNYGDAGKPPSGDPTFDGMYYDFEPVYHNPPSNQWFGYQTWPMERVAEYYQQTGNAQAGAILKKWVAWAESVVTVNTTTGAICEPGKLNWSGAPAESFTTGTSSATQPPANPGLHVTVTGDCAADLGVAASLAKTYMYYAAKSGDTTAQTAAQNIIDVIHQFYGDSIGFSAPESRTDYNNFTSAFNTTNFEGLFIPANWSGSYPSLGSATLTSADNTFLSIRPWYTSVPDYPEVQNYLNGGAAPVFNYHRFWAEADIATAFDSFAFLFPNVSPPASATPTVTVTNPGNQTSSLNAAASLQIKATDSASGKTLTYSATDLPLGLSLNASTGAITGTPTAAGSYTTVVTVNDGSGASSVNFTWTIGTAVGNTVTVTNPGNQTGTVGTAVSLQIKASDSAAGQTLSYSATNLPAGLSISATTGLITGTPTANGNSSVVVTVKDTTGASGTAAFTWTIGTTGNTVTVTNPGNQTGTVGTAVSLQIKATDSAAGQTLSYSAANLPAGLSISATTGLITGTPTTAGTSSVTVTVKDTTGATGTAAFTWAIGTTGGGFCHVTYAKASEWQGGVVANVTINNTGTSAINNWTLTFTFPGDTKITNAWNGIATQTGENVTITNEPYNATIPAGGNTAMGFQGTWTNSDAAPTSFAVNGTTCT